MMVCVDQMDARFAKRKDADPNALPVLVGSHLDAQPTGRRYDGMLGGLEIIGALNELDVKTKHPIVVVNWANEEGSRFAPTMLAIGVFTGLHDLSWA